MRGISANVYRLALGFHNFAYFERYTNWDKTIEMIVKIRSYLQRSFHWFFLMILIPYLDNRPCSCSLFRSRDLGPESLLLHYFFRYLWAQQKVGGDWSICTEQAKGTWKKERKTTPSKRWNACRLPQVFTQKHMQIEIKFGKPCLLYVSVFLALFWASAGHFGGFFAQRSITAVSRKPLPLPSPPPQFKRLPSPTAIILFTDCASELEIGTLTKTKGDPSVAYSSVKAECPSFKI